MIGWCVFLRRQCIPTFPYSFGRRNGERQTRKLPPFYALDADLPTLLTLVAGFQHSLAMLAGGSSLRLLLPFPLPTPR